MAKRGQTTSKLERRYSRYINCDLVYLIRWQVADDWFVNLVPQYTYSVNGRKISLFELVTQVGHNINKETSMAINTDEDDNFG
ncbi:hypothetical protein O9929_15915 [Vibrio lentus]|nr:hypothetical protein [Vibrio lentus]